MLITLKIQFFAARVINELNGLPETVNFSGGQAYKNSIRNVNLTSIYVTVTSHC